MRHTGYVNVALRARKLDRDSRILQEELKHRPDEPFILFNLGAIAIERRNWRRALDYLRKSLARSAPSDSITRKLFALIARSHQMLGETAAALRICAEGLSLDAQDAELLFRKAVVHRNRGESAEAEACWRRILGLRRPEQFASLDMGIYGHLTREIWLCWPRNEATGRRGRQLWAEVLGECPGDREALAALEASRATPQPRRWAESPTGHGPWLVAGSHQRVVPDPGTTDFGPYAELAREWVVALQAQVILELGVRFGDATARLAVRARTGSAVTSGASIPWSATTSSTLGSRFSSPALSTSTTAGSGSISSTSISMRPL